MKPNKLLNDGALRNRGIDSIDSEIRCKLVDISILLAKRSLLINDSFAEMFNISRMQSLIKKFNDYLNF